MFFPLTRQARATSDIRPVGNRDLREGARIADAAAHRSVLLEQRPDAPRADVAADRAAAI